MTDRQLLRHALATLAYRAAKPLRDAPPEFAAFKCGPTSRTPGEIVAHLGDLMEWGGWMARGTHKWSGSKPGDWSSDVTRFFDELKIFDEVLASSEDLGATCERLFQGPIADSVTHVGQLTMLRRLGGVPIRGENYSRADIRTGQTGLTQPPANVEFD